jgi:hypothetical protein
MAMPCRSSATVFAMGITQPRGTICICVVTTCIVIDVLAL